MAPSPFPDRQRPSGGKPILLTLIGLPGSGKSTVGRQLAKRLDLTFADTDHVIEQRIGCPIREFFERNGEEAFRDIEEQVIAELSSHAGVLATGGGAVLRAANRERLRENGTVIYMCTTPDELFRRLRRDRTRPLLQVDDPLGRLRELHAQRDPLYRETAHFTVDASGMSVPALLRRVMSQLESAGIVPPQP